MMNHVESRLRRATLADGFGAALVLACALFLATGGWTTLKGGAALFNLGAPAVATAQAPAAPVEIASRVELPR